jgi:hypothetical protein
MPKRPSDFRDAWEALKLEAALLEAEPKARHGLVPNSKVEEQESRVAALCVSQDAVAHGAWETKARDLNDVLLLSEICWAYFWGLGTFPQLPADIENRHQREIAVAYLLR